MNTLQKKVLLVESNPQFRSLLATFFSGDFSVAIARSDIEAWRMLRADYTPNVMLVGLNQISDKIEILEHLRSNALFSDIPIVLLSERPEAFAKNARSGWEIYGKPVDLLQLNKRLKEITAQ